MKTLTPTMLRLAAPALLCLPWAPALHAQQPAFTFQIPVQLSDVMHEVSAANVRCAVYEPGDPPFGFGTSQTQAISPDGSLDHTFTVEVVVAENQYDHLSSPSFYWRCWLEMQDAWGIFRSMGQNGLPDPDRPFTVSRPGTVRTVMVDGTISR